LRVLRKAFQYRSQCTAKVSLEIYVINFDVTSCCGYCNRRGKAPAVVKVAASTVTMDVIDYSEVTLMKLL